MSPTKVFIVFDWYQSQIIGTYSSLEKAKDVAEEHEAYCKNFDTEVKWFIVENYIDGEPTRYSNVVYDHAYENKEDKKTRKNRTNDYSDVCENNDDSVFIVFDWYQIQIVGTYSSLEKAKETAEEHEAHCKRQYNREVMWLVVENKIDGQPERYSNIVYEHSYENKK